MCVGVCQMLVSTAGCCFAQVLANLCTLQHFDKDADSCKNYKSSSDKNE